MAVATLAAETCVLHRRLNSDLLVSAAIVHDIGKLREFTYGAEIGPSERGALLGQSRSRQQLLEPLRRRSRPEAPDRARALHPHPPRSRRRPPGGFGRRRRWR